jgi:hypothetical protein
MLWFLQHIKFPLTVYFPEIYNPWPFSQENCQRFVIKLKSARGHFYKLCYAFASVSFLRLTFYFVSHMCGSEILEVSLSYHICRLCFGFGLLVR